jgi:hypothetical protein
MTKQEHINLVSFNDYVSLRKQRCASNVAWNSIKSLNTHLGLTVWQLFQDVADKTGIEYDNKFEPTLTHIEIVSKKLN